MMTNEQMITYVGGASKLSAALISSVNNILKTLYNFGQNLGSSIGRMIRGTTC